MMERIHINQSAAVEDYLEYRRVVGEDDEGRLCTPEEYQEYKRKVLPTRQRNRLYVSCGVRGRMDCKLIGPETPCFCSHRYKQHLTDFEVVPPERPLALPCRVGGCRCVAYQYVHLNGSQPVRCLCKHATLDHSEAPGHHCRKCSTCTGFRSPFTCGCGQPSFAHETLVETREERLARGRPVGQDVPYVAMGGLTGFSSLAEGYMRLDDSGIGAAPHSVPEAAGSRRSQEHVFERAYGSHGLTAGHETASVELLTGQLSDLKTREDEDMTHFERRYQERLKMKRTTKQTAFPAKFKQPTKSQRK